MAKRKSTSAPTRWAVQWNQPDDQYLLWRQCLPLLFTTRSKARAWIEDNYGFIKTRPDLRSSPHNWRLPKAVKVEVILRPKRGHHATEEDFRGERFKDALRWPWGRRWATESREAMHEADAEKARADRAEERVKEFEIEVEELGRDLARVECEHVPAVLAARARKEGGSR